MARPGAAQTAEITKADRTVARTTWRSMCSPFELPFRTRTRTKLDATLRTIPSVQLKIECHHRNHFHRLAVDPHRLAPPILHRIDGRVRKRRLAFQQLLKFHPAVLHDPHLQLDSALHA